MDADIKSIWHFLSFDRKEVKNLLLSSILISIIVAFRRWGNPSFDLTQGLINTLFAFIVSFAILVISTTVSKAFAIRRGYLGRYVISIEGLLVGLMLSFITYGGVWFFPYGMMLYDLENKLRIGRFPFHLHYKDTAKATFWGSFSIITIAFILRYIHSITGIELFRYAMQITVAFAIMSVLPIPKSNGITILYQSRMRYAFNAGIILAMCLFIYVINSFWISLFLSFILGFGAIYIWNKNIEKHFG